MIKNLENIAEKLKSMRYRLAHNQFSEMDITQLVEYASKNPNCQMFQDYISNCCSPSRIKEFLEQTECYEKNN